jgi:hypothetical protein
VFERKQQSLTDNDILARMLNSSVVAQSMKRRNQYLAQPPLHQPKLVYWQRFGYGKCLVAPPSLEARKNLVKDIYASGRIRTVTLTLQVRTIIQIVGIDLPVDLPKRYNSPQIAPQSWVYSKASETLRQELKT